MAEFLDASFTLPTAVFTALLALVVVYWLLVVAGALEIEALDGLDAAGDAIDAAAEGLPHPSPGAGSGPALLNALGVRDVPLTIWLSIVVLVGWAVSLIGMQALGGALGSAAGPLVAVAALALGVAAAAVAVRPLRPVFASNIAVSNRALVGKTCTITTLRVDEGFGQALVEDGAAGLLVQVRCSDANDLTRGAQALIFDYNPDEGAFHVARYDEPAVGPRG